MCILGKMTCLLFHQPLGTMVHQCNTEMVQWYINRNTHYLSPYHCILINSHWSAKTAPTRGSTFLIFLCSKKITARVDVFPITTSTCFTVDETVDNMVTNETVQRGRHQLRGRHRVKRWERGRLVVLHHQFEWVWGGGGRGWRGGTSRTSRAVPNNDWGFLQGDCWWWNPTSITSHSKQYAIQFAPMIPISMNSQLFCQL